MSRRHFGRPGLPYRINVGTERLAAAERALEAGDKVEALHQFARAYNATHESHADGAPEALAKAKAAVDELLADFRRQGNDRPFGEALCCHGYDAGRLVCWLCSEAAAKPEPAPLAKTTPEASDDELLAAMVEERRANAETIEAVDAENLAKRKAGER